MAETVKRMWLRDKDGVKISPTVELNQVLKSDGTKFASDFDTLKDRVTTVEGNYCRFMKGTASTIAVAPTAKGIICIVGTAIYVSTGTSSENDWMKVFEGGTTE